MRRLLRIFLRLAFLLIAGGAVAWIAIEIAISTASRGRAYSDIGSVPRRQAALVLGTSKFVPDGGINLHYRYRIEAAADLFHAGRVDYLIVSGNGTDPHYNEPHMMRSDLQAAGVPGDRIYCDYAGLRTLDSVIRAATIYGASDCIVVSQPAHAARAIFIGRMNGQNLISYEARNVPFTTDPKTAIREQLARVLAVLDTTVLNKRPQILGDKVRLGASPPHPGKESS